MLKKHQVRVACTVSHVASMAEPGLRPSPWPVRTQRRHAAAASFSDAVLLRLTEIAERVRAVEKAVHGLRIDAPPGLVHARQGPEMERMQQQVNRLEALLACSPAVDEVLGDRLARGQPSEPTVDEMLDDMLARGKSAEKPFPCIPPFLECASVFYGGAP